jgi:hypothetical protein
MTVDRETLHLVAEWLDDGRTRLPDTVLDAVLRELPSRPQRRRSWLAPQNPTVDALAKAALAAAAVVVAAVVGLNVLGTSGNGPAQGGTPSALPSPSASVAPSASPSAVASPSPSATPQLPALRLPGTTSSPAGEYGWTGRAGGFPAQLHTVEGVGERALIFQVGGGCREAIEKKVTRPVHLAGFDGVAVEPYEPPVPFGAPGGDEVTRAHALAVGDRTLCVYLTWSRDTTASELESVERVLDTLRAEPINDDLVRVTFILDSGWDTG